MTATTIQRAPESSIEFEGHRFALEALPCDFCANNEFLPLWNKMRHGLNLNTVMCKRCGLCMTNPRPTAEANALFYSQLYNKFHKREATLDLGSDYVKRSRKQAQPRVELLSRYLDPQQSFKVFEIGAGVGQFQVAARERTKWQVSGLEPGNEQSALCKQQGLDVTQAFFQDMPLADESLDAVVSFHVLEHVDSPARFIRHANRVLKPGGILHLEVPNLSRWGEGRLSDFLQFPHLYNFTALTLRNYLTVIGGFTTLFTSERSHALSMVARKSESASSEPAQPGEFEQFDVPDFMQRLRMMERLRRLTRWIPGAGVLGKVRSTLEAI